MRTFRLQWEKECILSWAPTPFFLKNCTWMLTELCLFPPIGFSPVSVNINHVYQGLQCAEWLAKSVLQETDGNESPRSHGCWIFLITENLGGRHQVSHYIFSSFGPSPGLLFLHSIFIYEAKTDWFSCSIRMASDLKTFSFLSLKTNGKNLGLFFQVCLLE